jgi:hypothetical protein
MHGTTGIPLLWEVFTIKGSNIFNQDKIAEQPKLKTMERALRVYHVA